MKKSNLKQWKWMLAHLYFQLVLILKSNNKKRRGWQHWSKRFHAWNHGTMFEGLVSGCWCCYIVAIVNGCWCLLAIIVSEWLALLLVNGCWCCYIIATIGECEVTFVPLPPVLQGDYAWKHKCYRWRTNTNVCLVIRLHS
jgi:hypothetical protein